MDYLLGLCIGTSSTKALLTDVEGNIIGDSEVKYGIDSPYEGWTEQKPDTWLLSSIKAIKDILKKNNINPSDILSMGISGQAHSAVFLDKHLRVIRPAPLWNDQRTTEECMQLQILVGREKILKLTSNKPTTAFTLPKILWLRNQEPDNFKKLFKICLSKDYVKLGLSGTLSTDPSDAATTLCYDVKNYCWSETLMAELGLDSSILPDVNQSGDFSARVSKKMARETGLKQGLPILTGSTDTAGEMLGNSVYKDGQGLIILGTGGVFLIYHSDYYENKGPLDIFCFPDGNYFSLGVTLSSSASLMWGLNNLGLDLTALEKDIDQNMKYADLKKYITENMFKILDSGVGSIPIGSDGLIFLPYLTGERSPHADPAARGVLFGLNMLHDKRHILRSIMEGVAFSQRDCSEVVKKEGFSVKEIVISGGGAKNSIWCQMFSDIFNSKIVKMSSEEGPSLGMCILGSVSSGVYSSLEEAFAKFLKVHKVYKPKAGNVKVYDELFKIYAGLYLNLKNSFLSLEKFKKMNR